MAERIDKIIEEIRQKNASELETASNEQEMIDNAHLLLDILLTSYSTMDRQTRILDVDKFLEQIAKIEDFEIANPYVVDVEQLEMIAQRAMDFARREQFVPGINKNYADEIMEFVREFYDLAFAITTSKDKTFSSVVDEEKQGKMKPRFSLPDYKLCAIPTKKYIEMQQKSQQSQQQINFQLTQEERQDVLHLIEQQPDKILRLETKYFVDPTFAERLRILAIESFPRAYREHCQTVYGESVRRGTVADATKKFQQVVDSKVEREFKTVKSAKRGDGKN